MVAMRAVFSRSLFVRASWTSSPPLSALSVRHKSSLPWIGDSYQQLPPMDKETVKHAVKDTKNQFVKLKDEVVDRWTRTGIINMEPYHVHKVFTFDSVENLALWRVTCDQEYGTGYSTAELALNENMRSCVFRGNIDRTIPRNGSNIVRSGYCNITIDPEMKSFHRRSGFDWRSHTHLEVRCRGDGRTYLLVLGARGTFDIWESDIYIYPLHTRGGPYWQTTKIPFSKFLLMSYGCIQDAQCPVTLEKVTHFGITATKFAGHFQLELDYVGISYDPYFREEFAYETYRIPVGIS